MPYVTSAERYGFAKGQQEGQLQEARVAILEVLTARFTKVPDEIASALQRLEALDRLHGLLRQAVRCPTIAALQEMLHTA